jgi:hypothetical protein
MMGRDSLPVTPCFRNVPVENKKVKRRNDRYRSVNRKDVVPIEQNKEVPTMYSEKLETNLLLFLPFLYL